MDWIITFTSFNGFLNMQFARVPEQISGMGMMRKQALYSVDAAAVYGNWKQKKSIVQRSLVNTLTLGAACCRAIYSIK